MTHPVRFVGIDVGKARLDVAVADGPAFRALSDPSGSENRTIHLFQRIIFVRQVCNLAG